MSPLEMKTVLEFYMSKLSDAELAELDAMMAGGDPDASAMAGDAKQRAWIALDSRARIAARRARASRGRQNPEDSAAFDAMFPNANRLR